MLTEEKNTLKRFCEEDRKKDNTEKDNCTCQRMKEMGQCLTEIDRHTEAQLEEEDWTYLQKTQKT